MFKTRRCPRVCADTADGEPPHPGVSVAGNSGRGSGRDARHPGRQADWRGLGVTTLPASPWARRCAEARGPSTHATPEAGGHGVTEHPLRAPEPHGDRVSRKVYNG